LAGKPSLIVALLVAAGTCLGACATGSAILPPAPDQIEDDFALAVTALASQAEACNDDPPEGFNSAGLELLASHAAAWAEQLGQADLAGPASCDLDLLVLNCGRAGTLGLRLAASNTADAASLVAMQRALRVDLALTAGLGRMKAGEVPASPELTGLFGLDPELLTDLVLAEDQAGFLQEYLAANSPLTAEGTESPERAKLVASAQLHRLRAASLTQGLARAEAPDPRQPAYQIERLNGDLTVALAAARIELTLASHYTALPYDFGAEDLITWQLLVAHSWGAELPPWPFVS